MQAGSPCDRTRAHGQEGGEQSRHLECLHHSFQSTVFLLHHLTTTEGPPAAGPAAAAGPVPSQADHNVSGGANFTQGHEGSPQITAPHYSLTPAPRPACRPAAAPRSFAGLPHIVTDAVIRHHPPPTASSGDRDEQRVSMPRALSARSGYCEGRHLPVYPPTLRAPLHFGLVFRSRSVLNLLIGRSRPPFHR